MQHYFSGDLIAKSSNSMMELNLQLYEYMDNADSYSKYITNTISSYEDILVELSRIQLQSKDSKLLQDMFQCYYMKIFFILYIIYIRNTIGETLCLKNKRITYVVVVDHYIDRILGDNQILLGDFARTFGLLPKDTSIKNFILYKKREVYLLKLQELPVIQALPDHSRFCNYQITKNHCHFSISALHFDPQLQKLVSADHWLNTAYVNFDDQLTGNLWTYVENVLCQNDRTYSNISTLDNFNMFKTKLVDIFNILVSSIGRY
jgi:hypothetical protein